MSALHEKVDSAVEQIKSGFTSGVFFEHEGRKYIITECDDYLRTRDEVERLQRKNIELNEKIVEISKIIIKEAR